MKINRAETGLVVSFLCAASMWFYVQRILIPYQLNNAAATSRPRGNLSDLYPRWLGARELLLHHRDPYSPELTREIQTGYYGRPLDPTRPSDPKDQQAFAYPAYVVFLLAPTIFLPFSIVHTIFLWLLIFLTAMSVYLWTQVIGWKLSTTTVITLVVFSLGSFQAIQGFKLQQLSLLVSGLISISAVAIMRGRYWLAGFLLALATIKPQLTLLLVVWLLLWAFSARRRIGLVYSFGLTMAALVVGAEYVLPGWIERFRAALAAYAQYTGGLNSTLDILLTPVWGRLLAGVLVAGTALLCWRLRREPATSPAFGLSTSLVLTLTVVIVPMTAPNIQILLLPGIFLLIQNWRLLVASRTLRGITLICTIIICWPWLASIGLASASLAMPMRSLQSAWRLPLYTSLAIPSAVFALMVVCAGRITAEFQVGGASLHRLARWRDQK